MATVGTYRTGRFPGCRVKDGGKEFGRRSAGDLRSGRRAGGRSDDQIGVGDVQPGIAQAGDDPDQPRVARRSAAAEDQRTA
jgi:hypothetical protein